MLPLDLFDIEIAKLEIWTTETKVKAFEDAVQLETYSVEKMSYFQGVRTAFRSWIDARLETLAPEILPGDRASNVEAIFTI